MSLASAFCLSLTNVPLGPLGSVVYVELHELALMTFCVSGVLPAAQRVVASLFSHIWQISGMIDDYVAIHRDVFAMEAVFA